MSLRYSQIISRSWELTAETPRLKWFAFFPAFAAVIVFVVEIAWQAYLYWSEFGWGKDNSYVLLKETYSVLCDYHLIWWVIFMTIFVLIFTFVLPPLIFSTMVLSVRQRAEHPEISLNLRQKIIEGARHFFPIFEFNALMAPFGFLTIVFFTLSMYRYYHGTIFNLLVPFIIIQSILAFLLNLFFFFAPYFIICEEVSVTQSLKKSIALVFLHLEKTIGIILLIFLINLRVIINVIVVLGVPVGVLATLSYFATSQYLTLAVILAVGIAALVLGLTAYMTAILDVFTTSVWERSYAYLQQASDENIPDNAHEDPAC